MRFFLGQWGTALEGDAESDAAGTSQEAAWGRTLMAVE